MCSERTVFLRASDALMAPVNVPMTYETWGRNQSHMLMVFDSAADPLEAIYTEYAPLIGVMGEPDPKKLADCYARHGMTVVAPPMRTLSFTA